MLGNNLIGLSPGQLLTPRPSSSLPVRAPHSPSVGRGRFRFSLIITSVMVNYPNIPGSDLVMTGTNTAQNWDSNWLWDVEGVVKGFH